jgi:acetyl-CoA synthetase
VKFDPAKLEEKLLAFPGPPPVREAVAIGARDAIKGERIVCFVVLASGELSPAEGFTRELRTYIKQNYDPLAQPDEVHVVSQLPQNLAAKIPRKLVRLVYEGKPAGNLTSLTNPEALDEIRRAAERANAEP